MRFLKRFPESKHEQIRQLMSYIEMCGVSGRDLVSIGGYIDRRAASDRYQAAKERVKAFIDQKTICPIGYNTEDQLANRFKYRGITGNYNFVRNGWSSWEVTSLKTKIKKTINTSNRSWPSHVRWGQREFYDMVLDIADGNVQLNF
jgi:hypothetical protein